MIGYRCEVTEIEIYAFDQDVAAQVECFDECSSEVKVATSVHTVESWRELSAKIEEALLQIHQAK
jgi:predicted lipoprotein with Yx(FWY)xxD motif